MYGIFDIKTAIHSVINRFKKAPSQNDNSAENEMINSANFEENNESIIQHKVSVIIPTVHKAMKVLTKLLDILYEDEAVDEIWIINNAQEKLNFSHPKLKIYNSEENLYVNASWNLGISLIKNDKFLIINDDILGCKDFVSKVAETGILDKPDTGLVVVESEYVHNYDNDNIDDIDIPVYYKNIPVTIKPFVDLWDLGNWGSVIFGRTECYTDIPSDLKIYFGDNYLIEKNNDNGKKNYIFSGIRFNHIHWASSKDKKLQAIVRSDYENNEKYFKNSPRHLYLYYDEFIVEE